MARSENEVDQIVFRWDSDNLSGSTGFGPVAWSASREEVETLFGIFGALLRASGEETRPALLRLHQRAGVLLIRRTPWTDPGGRSSAICHALVGPPELLDPATCLGLHAWNWEGAALPLADVRGPLPVVPAQALVRAAGRGFGALDLPGVEAELIGTTAELLRNPKARFTLLDERGDAAPAVLCGLHGMFGGLFPDRRWTFASHDTLELPALRFVFVGKWAGAASRNTDRRRVDPRERLGDRAEDIAARLVHHHLRARSEGATVADALCAVPGADHLPLLETAERALTALDHASSRRETYDDPNPGRGVAVRDPWGPEGAGDPPRDDSAARAPRVSWDTGVPPAPHDSRSRVRREDPAPATPGDGRETGDPPREARAVERDGPRPLSEGEGGARHREGPEPRGGCEGAGPYREGSVPGGARPLSDVGEGAAPHREAPEPRGPREGGDVEPDVFRGLHEERDARARREATEPRGARPLSDGGAAAGPHREGPEPRNRGEALGPYRPGVVPPVPRDAPVAGRALGHDSGGVSVVDAVWHGPEGGARRRVPRVRRRGRVVETGLVRRLAAAGDDAEARVRAGGDGELLDALRRPQPYAVTTLLMHEVARRLPSWDPRLRREFRDLVIAQELFVTAPRSTHHGEPTEAERAANAAALHRWAVRPLLDEGDVPAGALAALLSRLRSSPLPAARSAFRQIVDDERPGLPEGVWRALLREAYAQPPAPRRPAPAAPAPVSRPAPPPPPPPRQEAPPAPSAGDDRVIVFVIVAVLALLVIFIISYYMTGDG
ncbi:hypothetical protein ACFV9D_34980 [Streptomyces sp. NPDC059875]|uniref:hypothetical protein n=1 Tax=unclassified Streptomyces TaxID=2593676 RepID=UPI00365AA33C